MAVTNADLMATMKRIEEKLDAFNAYAVKKEAEQDSLAEALKALEAKVPLIPSE